MLSFFYWDPNPEIFRVPGLGIPVLWYSVFFALGFVLGFPLFVSVLIRFLKANTSIQKENLKKTATVLADQLLIYVIIGVVVGARLGHFLFYESPREYLKDPWELFCVWKGGLASHGGIVGVLFAIFLFRKKIKAKFPSLTFLKILDLFSLPAPLIAFCIRIGNFFNQEILGKPTDLPWAVLFGHPMGCVKVVPRHPAQLYEACFYLLLFFLFRKLSLQKHWIEKEGKMAGLLLMLIFLFRFCIEFVKEEQSHLTFLPHFLTMGQLLSIPLFLFGFLIFFRGLKKD